MSYTRIYSMLILLTCISGAVAGQGSTGFRIVGYYAGPTASVDSFETYKLTHLIFCFGHLKGNRLSIGSAEDSATIRSMVLKKRLNPVGGAVVRPVRMSSALRLGARSLHNRLRRSQPILVLME